MKIGGYQLSARAAEAEARRAAGAQISALESTPVVMGDAGVFEWFGGGQKAAGVTVSPETAMRSTAVWRCTTLLSGTMMSAPLGVYERLADNARRYVPEHPYNRFLQVQPNEEMSGPDFIELQAMHMLLRGNGYGLMRQARNGTITSIDYFHPARVMPYYSGKTVWYRFTNLDGSTEDHHNSYVIHFRGPGRDAGGIRALSPIAHHAEAIGVNLATRSYTAGQFERGLLTNDYIGFPADQTVTKEQRDALREYLRKRALGVTNAHNPLLLERGAEWKRVNISAKDAQLLELLQYSVVDVARIFGVPPHMIGETSAATSWGTGIEQMTIGFKLYTAVPHLVRFAKELSRKLFPVIGARPSNLFIDFDVEAMQVGDSKSQGEYFTRALGGNNGPGWMSQDEVRRMKNLPPLNTEQSRSVFYPTAPIAGVGHNGGPALEEDAPEGEPAPAQPKKDANDDA